MTNTADMQPEGGHAAREYLDSHRVLPLVHRALNAAVRDRAPNPLLHMARTLRAEARMTSPHSPATATAVVTSPCAPAAVTVPAMPPSPPRAPPPISDLRSADGGHLEVVEVTSEEQLRALLEADGIDLSSWGAAGAEDVRHLFAELLAGESTLCRTEAGALRRVVRYVEVELRLRSGRVLVLTHEEFDGYARRKFELPRSMLRGADDNWQCAAQRAIDEPLEDAGSTLSLHEESRSIEMGVVATGWSYPGLACEYAKQHVLASLDNSPSATDALCGVRSERFYSVRRPSVPPSSRPTGQPTSAPTSMGASRPPGGSLPPEVKLHWAWYPAVEWATIKRKKEEQEAQARQLEASRASTDTTEPKPCSHVQNDGLGDLILRDDELGPAATQLKVVAQLYLGCSAVWYHIIAGGQSRAKILHVQAVDASGQWQDPTICKLSPIDLLRAEAEAHACFARYIGESVPQRIGEPVYVDEVGGMVLELVGACWRVPELAHTQAVITRGLEPS